VARIWIWRYKTFSPVCRGSNARPGASSLDRQPPTSRLTSVIANNG
jgi:hypothetical protein